MSSYYYKCVLILLCMCPHATICASSYCYILGEKWFHQPYATIYMHPHTAMYISLMLLYMCPSAIYMCTIYVSLSYPHTARHIYVYNICPYVCTIHVSYICYCICVPLLSSYCYIYQPYVYYIFVSSYCYIYQPYATIYVSLCYTYVYYICLYYICVIYATICVPLLSSYC